MTNSNEMTTSEDFQKSTTRKFLKDFVNDLTYTKSNVSRLYTQHEHVMLSIYILSIQL